MEIPRLAYARQVEILTEALLERLLKLVWDPNGFKFTMHCKVHGVVSI